MELQLDTWTFIYSLQTHKDSALAPKSFAVLETGGSQALKISLNSLGDMGNLSVPKGATRTNAETARVKKAFWGPNSSTSDLPSLYPLFQRSPDPRQTQVKAKGEKNHRQKEGPRTPKTSASKLQQRELDLKCHEAKDRRKLHGRTQLELVLNTLRHKPRPAFG